MNGWICWYVLRLRTGRGRGRCYDCVLLFDACSVWNVKRELTTLFCSWCASMKPNREALAIAIWLTLKWAPPHLSLHKRRHHLRGTRRSDGDMWCLPSSTCPHLFLPIDSHAKIYAQLLFSSLLHPPPAPHTHSIILQRPIHITRK